MYQTFIQQVEYLLVTHLLHCFFSLTWSWGIFLKYRINHRDITWNKTIFFLYMKKRLKQYQHILTNLFFLKNTFSAHKIAVHPILFLLYFKSYNELWKECYMPVYPIIILNSFGAHDSKCQFVIPCLKCDSCSSFGYSQLNFNSIKSFFVFFFRDCCVTSNAHYFSIQSLIL